MTSFAFTAPPPPALAIAGSAERFPVHRIYCIGRNYAEHAREMGAVPDKGSPVFFLKPADSVVALPGPVAYPPATGDLHHEVELVVALARGGRDIAQADALAHVYGYAIGLDLTRRDLQGAAKAKGLPWDTGKSFEQAAPIGPIHPVAEVGHPDRGTVALDVNGEPRQRGDLADLLFPVAEIIALLSRLFTLAPGDLIFTGTPAGVGPLQPGDRFVARIDALGEVAGSIV
jgi:fumarylpyruvate hydrolase